ncbi:hypothetical protein GWK47_036232 [Chionoecetes opilio]|uniref:DDE Tnp4 domain-containing protein n=1 Tax=Chionoecetes opilio TaxID=41210 RepID=A0A8J4YEL4_CHIOP|nr:hypothetical protein GWK47_036232 [Chionoecetes opilio]
MPVGVEWQSVRGDHIFIQKLSPFITPFTWCNEGLCHDTNLYFRAQVRYIMFPPSPYIIHHNGNTRFHIIQFIQHYRRSIIEVERQALYARWLEDAIQLATIAAEEEDEEEDQAELQRRGIRRRRVQRRKAIWCRQWLARRPLYGQYEQLLQEGNREDPNGYKNFLRMDADLFGEIVERISPRIKKKDTNYRQALEPGLKLAVTLRHLAAGASYADLMYSFRVAKNTMCVFIPEVLEAIIQEYAEEVLPPVITPEQWRQIADDFETKWNFPHACGALMASMSV